MKKLMLVITALSVQAYGLSDYECKGEDQLKNKYSIQINIDKANPHLSTGKVFFAELQPNGKYKSKKSIIKLDIDTEVFHDEEVKSYHLIEDGFDFEVAADAKLHINFSLEKMKSDSGKVKPPYFAKGSIAEPLIRLINKDKKIELIKTSCTYKSYPQQVMCNIPVKQNEDYFINLSTSCPDYVETVGGQFVPNESACLTAMTSVKIVTKNKNFLKNIPEYVTGKTLKCYVGLRNAVSEELVLTHIVDQNDLLEPILN